MWASTNDDVEGLRRLYRVSSHNLDGLPWVKIGSHLHRVSSNDKGRDVERLIAECVSQVLA
jgi:hypothetical protein